MLKSERGLIELNSPGPLRPDLRMGDICTCYDRKLRLEGMPMPTALRHLSTMVNSAAS